MRKLIGSIIMTSLILTAAPTWSVESNDSDVNQTITKIQDLLRAREAQKQEQLKAIVSLKKQVIEAEDKIRNEAIGGVVSAGMIIFSIYLIKINSGDSFVREFTKLGAAAIGTIGVAGTAYNAYRLSVNLKDLPKFKRALVQKEAQLEAEDLQLKNQIEALKDE